MLSRKEMEELVATGQGVLYQGRIITRISDLPDEVELVGNDPLAKEALSEDLTAQLARIQAQLAQLKQAEDDRQSAVPLAPVAPPANIQQNPAAPAPDTKKNAGK